MIDLDKWESSDIKQMLSLLVGQEYGTDPMLQLDQIRKTKHHEANNIVDRLGLVSSDRVIDLGSGCGFIAQIVATRVKSVACVDISQSFLDYAMRLNAHHKNVDYHCIPFADLSGLARSSAIYSTAVFIHFNLYDCYLYLKECYNNLEPNGKMMFNILNDRCIDVFASRWQRHSNRYLQRRESIFTNVHFLNPTAVTSISQQLGFFLEQTYDEQDQTFFILRKPG